MSSEFFRQVAGFSEQALKDLGCETSCRWKTAGWPPASPLGLILHYTGGTLRSALRWFMHSSGARASAHFVIGRSWPDPWKELAKPYPLVSSLAAPVVQCVPLEDRAWHAPAVNHTHLGIELANHGEVRKNERGQWVYWAPEREGAPEWTARWKPDGVVLSREPAHLFGRFWEPYPNSQLLTLVRVAREIREVYPLSSESVFGHEQVQANKRDPGPAFPLAFFRGALFAPRAWEDPLDGVSVQAQDLEFVRVHRLIDDWATKRFPLVPRGDLQASKAALLEVLAHPEDGPSWENVQTTSLAFDLLGYVKASLYAVQVFQRALGLGVDGVVGEKTRRALAQRVLDRGIV